MNRLVHPSLSVRTELMIFSDRVSLLLRHPRHSLRMFLKGSKAPPFWGAHAFGADDELVKFHGLFSDNLKNCNWKPHPQYSVFTQYDQDFYLEHKEAFLHKYKCFYAVSKTIAPHRIIELGTHAGASADAYISGTPDAEYLGFDQFDDGVLRGVRHQISGVAWQPRQVATELFEARGFENYQLIQADLRSLDKLPFSSDFVVVDAAHDFENQYADLKLALTAKPSFIFVDDADGLEVIHAIQKFLADDVKGCVDFFCGIGYIGGGLVIKLRSVD